jgi:hypothetical protein
MSGTTARLMRNAPFAMTAKVRSQSSSEQSTTGVGLMIAPAFVDQCVDAAVTLPLGWWDYAARSLVEIGGAPGTPGVGTRADLQTDAAPSARRLGDPPCPSSPAAPAHPKATSAIV